MDDQALVSQAAKALTTAYAPYSKVRVGACVETESGEVFCACNVENASYGLTMCAERAAIFQAVAGGHQMIKKVAIVGEGIANPMPCGACLQVMQEFGVEKVMVGSPEGGFKTYEFASLLPKPFSL
jgi:cytidine deaminase